ncbi:GntR family transcriptional regulator [Clavibacter zhangzhiyongii]|uniref:GntR family transcriptional regulator n=1 Tax=Clavibacter zhangzhiyongii TaxID=2768071 RepID=UPI00195ABEA8|nr:GntR family transcriptional regulator [Clavibacter zhangzhiyongii]MBM7026781.1 GntR family transcriptional regulator [Clavibacter zhangzhiyongii]
MTPEETVPNRIDDLDPGAISSAHAGPLHAQLTALLRSRIVDGAWPPGSQLPTEAELQERFGVSRSVVRQSLHALTAEGLVQRGRGRGSIVAPRGELHRLVQRVSGLSTQVPSVTTRVLELAAGRDADAERVLGGSDVHLLRRLRSAGGEAVALIHTWLPRRIAERLTADDLTDASLHALLRSRLGVQVAAGRRQVRAVGASAEVAAALRVAEGAPVLVLEGTSTDASGDPVEVFRTWHRADRFVFDIDVLTGDGDPAPPTRTAAADAPAGASDPVVEAPSSSPDASSDDAALAARALALSRELADLARRLR